jgi:NitT/TauT family transport system permease protein
MKPSRAGQLSNIVIVTLTVSVFAAIWELTVKIFDVPVFILPPIEDLVEEFVHYPMFYAENAAFTLTNTLLGFSLAVILGVLFALIIVSSPLLERVFLTLLSAMHSVPKVALAPVFVIWFGTGMTAKIAIVVLITVFTIVIDTVVGLRSVDPDMLSMARSKQATALKILWKIQLPHALPNLFGALKGAIAISLVGAIVGEFVAGQQGLGFVILVAQGKFDTARAFVAIVILAVLGTLLFYCLSYLETKVLPWHVSQRILAPT